MGAKNGKTVKSTELNEDEINLLIANTHFKREEIVEWHEGFLVSFLITLKITINCYCDMKIDCPNGQLGKAKFVEVYKQFFKNGKADKFCECC